ncbi:MAG: hypothetical protein D6791_18045 [Chloroflexi bacterium]|nr:MAG: hypothetical protein D6791_18045 [Chloroflexota bacterium]
MMELQQDLFGFEMEEAPSQPRTLSAPRQDWRAEVAPPQPELPMEHSGFEWLYDWSDREVEIMREGLLFASLHDLCDARVAEWTREEIWEWIESDEIHPFSFRVCVAAYDASIDVQELRRHIRWLVEKLDQEESQDRNLDLAALLSR